MKPRALNDEQVGEAHRLYEGGMRQSDIARRFGVTQPTIWKALNPEKARASSKRSNAKRQKVKLAWKNAHRAPCPRCGTPMSGGSTYKSGHRDRCIDCWHAEQRQQRQERRQAIQELWNKGATLKQIAYELDSTKVTIGVEMVHMRDEGWDLPYRRRPAGSRSA